jgi:hypothetical protein
LISKIWRSKNRDLILEANPFQDNIKELAALDGVSTFIQQLWHQGKIFFLLSLSHFFAHKSEVVNTRYNLYGVGLNISPFRFTQTSRPSATTPASSTKPD